MDSSPQNTGSPRKRLRLVLIIIALLWIGGSFLIISPTAYSPSPAAKLTAAKNKLQAIITALNAFAVDLRRYPTTAEGLAPLVVEPTYTSMNSSWRGPYLEKVPTDPWGNPYLYTCPGKHHPQDFDLASAGPDGKFDTADDITNDQEK